jgi:signal-transduction protein with cAMP-binding, CBS, and nucleotidyltransferase domain
VNEAAELMKEWKIKHLPVTRDGKLTGMLTYLDIAFNVPELLPAMKELYRPSK